MKAAGGPMAGGALDPGLRDRTISDIAAFVVALDAAMAQNTRPALLALRDATNRLLHAASAAHIEIERVLGGELPGAVTAPTDMD